ncbi:MAG: hypothetical protein ACRECT_08130 [Thermoplasmata archaeon]
MILPGLVSIVFYRRRPTKVQIGLGLGFTVVFSALLAYFQAQGTWWLWWDIAAAVVGGVILYVAILAYLLYKYQPRHAGLTVAAPPASPP